MALPPAATLAPPRGRPALRILGRAPTIGDHQYEAVRAHLPAYVQPVVTFAFLTGWRVRSEVLTLQWRQVDFKAGIVRLDPGSTKNQEGRPFVMTPELRATLEAQRAVTEAKQKKTGSVIPWGSTARSAAGHSRASGRHGSGRASQPACPVGSCTISGARRSGTLSAPACRAAWP
jgi:integrase